MNSERATAYGRVVATIDAVGAVKLQPEEIERLRTAADTLLFSEDIGFDPTHPARSALEDIEELTEHLATSGRWTADRAQQLFDDLAECGPVAAAHR